MKGWQLNGLIGAGVGVTVMRLHRHLRRIKPGYCVQSAYAARHQAAARRKLKRSRREWRRLFRD